MKMSTARLLQWRLKFRKRFRSPEKAPAIALITTDMEKGGKEQVILDLYHGYKARGYRAYIVCQRWIFDSVKDLIDAPEDIFVFNDDLLMLLHFLWRRDVRRLHYHYNVFGIHELRQIGFRIVYTMHNTYTWMSDQEIREYAHKLENADAVVPVSDSVRDYFRSRVGETKIHYQVIRNGIDFSLLDREGAELPFTRESLGIQSGQIAIAMVGSFYHAKGQIGMLGVAEKLIQQYPQAVFVFLGSRGDENYYRRFMRELDKCPVRDHVILAPPIPHELMGAFYREIVDILALITLHEGGPLVAIEAMYCGCPMVLTPVGISPELADKAACLISDAAYDNLASLSDDDIKNHLSLARHPRNEASFTACLAEIIDHLEGFRQKAAACRKNAEFYSMDRMMEAYTRLIDPGSG